MTRQNAYRIIRSMEVAAAIAVSGYGVEAPKVERYAQILSVIPSEETRAAVWSDAVASAEGGRVRSEHVKAAVARVTGTENEAALIMQGVFRAISRLETKFIDAARPCKEADDVKTRFGKLLERMEFYCRTVEPLPQEAAT